MKSFLNLDLRGKRVLLRVDLNVPVKDGKIIDDSRITRLKPTIEKLKMMGAKIILLSHFGRPDGKKNNEFSLSFMREFLAQIYATKVEFIDDCIGERVIAKAHELKDSTLLLLENVRFYSQEETNDPAFAKELAKLAEVYINDAFACSHRAHASLSAITKFLPAYSGLLLIEEVQNLEKVFNSNNSPTLAIVAGKKVSTKFPILMNLISKVDKLFIAGAMANTFLVAQGKEIGSSYYEKEVLEEVKAFFLQHKNKIILPTDFTVAVKEGEQYVAVRVTEIINTNEAILDIGTASALKLIEQLKQVKTLLWNGPLGMYEDPRFAVATNLVAKVVADQTMHGDLVSVAGGGDIIAALEHAGFAKDFTYISTAGGAFLEWLEGKELPGIKALKNA